MVVRGRLWALVAAVVVMLAACGNGGGEKTTAGSATTGGGGSKVADLQARLASAAQEGCTKVRSGRLEAKMAVSGGTLSKAVVVGFTGAFDNASKRSHIKMDFTPLMAALGESTGTSGDQGMAAAFAKMEIVVDGDTTYVQSPFFGALFGGGKPWVKFTKDQQGQGASFTDAGFGANMCDFITVLKSVSSDVKQVGTENVAGSRAVHFKATIDLTKVGDATGGEEAQSFESFIKQAGLSEVPVDVWVGEDGIVRRIEIKMANIDLGTVLPGGFNGATSTTAQAKGSVSFTITFTDVNEKVTIDLPPPDQVGEPSGLFGNMSIPGPNEP